MSEALERRRQVRPEEMPAIIRLANRFPDLRDIEAELDRRAIEDGGETDAELRPRNIREAVELLDRKVISRHELRQLLGYRGWEARLPAIFRDWPNRQS